MSTNYFKLDKKLYRFFAGLVVATLLVSTMPAAVFAQEAASTTPSSDDISNASSTANGADNQPPQAVSAGDFGTSTPADTGNGADADDRATSTASTTPPISEDGGNASSTESGTDGDSSTSTDNTADGTDGNGDTNDGDTASTTPPTPDSTGETGSSGGGGNEGTAGANGEVTPEAGDPVEVKSDSLIGDPDEAEDNEVTGDIQRTGRKTLIETGIATARAELFTDANSNDVRSELTPEASGDLDFYTFIATGTNEAIVSNEGAILSSTGENLAIASTEATIKTGHAISAFNIANIINTNVVNSEGLIYLGNKILGPSESLDLTSSFFPEAATSLTNTGTCSLLSCAAEDVVYNMSQINTATVTNQAIVEATTGYNEADGNLSAKITTGDAFASVNVMNVINTNIIDSNYQLLTFNAIGDLEGDLILPSEDLFRSYFAQPNGLNQLEEGEAADISVTNTNNAVVENNLDTYGQTGNNDSETDVNSSIVTGMSETESNVLNKVNSNTYGGDSFYLRVRIHGYWNGEVVGLPDGLTWEWTPDGLIIYNVDAEIAPSEMFGYDIDSYSAQINNQNNALYLENTLTVRAITGENENLGLTGSIETGDAFASANVMNIANTNVIGTNWTYAVINILGDLDGNISFTSTDLGLTGVVNDSGPVGPNDNLTYTYTVSNSSDQIATNVVLDQVLENAKTNNSNNQSVSLGSVAPGASRVVTLGATVDSNIPQSTSSVTAHAKVTSDIGDNDFSNNLLTLVSSYLYTDSTDSGSDNTETDTTGDTTPPTITPPASSGGGGSGGGGSSSKNKKKKVDREVMDVDPDAQPLISINKTADVSEGEIINAGDSVDYTITVTNNGGNAYNAEVFDVLTNPIGSEVNSQSWDLSTILPGEEIKLTYTTDYNADTPSGIYTNTASVKAYLDEDTKASGGESLSIKDAVYKLQINGIALAVGNVATIAFFPSADGQTSALMAWETSTSSLSRIYYGPYQAISQYDINKPNLGYRSVSFMFPEKKTTHYMIITGLQPGTSYGYRVRSENETDVTTSREYTFVVPYLVNKLSLAIPATPTPAPQVAGISTTKPAYQAPKPTLTYVEPAPKPKPVIITPAPLPAPKPDTQKIPEPAPAPEPTPTPEPAPQTETEKATAGGFFSKVANFFSW